MANIFEVKKRYNEFVYNALAIQRDFHEFINESIEKSRYWNDLINESTKKYLGFLYSDKIEIPQNYPDDLVKEYLEILNDVKKYQLQSYSKFNMIVAYRFYVRKHNELNRELRQLKEIIRDYWDDLKEIEKDLLDLQHKHDIEKMLGIILSLKETLAYYKNFHFVEFNGKYLFDGLFIGKDNQKETITKDELVSILTIDKTKKIKEIIQKLPDEIDADVFWDVVFLEKIEDFQDDYCSDALIDAIFKARDNNPKLKKRMDDKLFELVPELGLHTFDVKFDQYGDVASIEKSKPRLRVLDGAMDYMPKEKISL